MQFRLDSVFPIPDRRLSNADDFCDFSLEETEVHAFLADVVADGDEMYEITGKWLFFKGKMD